MNKIGIGLAIVAASATAAAVAVSIINKYRKEKVLREVYDLSAEDIALADSENDDEVGGENDSRVSEFVGEQIVRESWNEDYPEWGDDCYEDEDEDYYGEGYASGDDSVELCDTEDGMEASDGEYDDSEDEFDAEEEEEY